MAYLITNQDYNLYRIASNENEKNDVNCFYPPYIAIDISDVDFLKIKKGIGEANISNGSATVTDLDLSGFYINEDELKVYHSDIIRRLKSFLRNKDSSKVLYSTCQTYERNLRNFDYSTITFPIAGKTWEQYCEDNSITYIHPLQIP
tara:strand:+ start:380 stop:820 length:441 start_codon:yes stop_codon:yes gene_type:complete